MKNFSYVFLLLFIIPSISWTLEKDSFGGVGYTKRNRPTTHEAKRAAKEAEEKAAAEAKKKREEAAKKREEAAKKAKEKREARIKELEAKRESYQQKLRQMAKSREARERDKKLEALKKAGVKNPNKVMGGRADNSTQSSNSPQMNKRKLTAEERKYEQEKQNFLERYKQTSANEQVEEAPTINELTKELNGEEGQENTQDPPHNGTPTKKKPSASGFAP